MNQALLQPLLADINQVIWVIVMVLVGLRWVYGLIQDTKKQVARQRPQQPGQRVPQQQRPRPQNGPQPAASPGGQQADPLRDQVEAFLRRASQQPQDDPRRTIQRPPQATAAIRIEILVDDEPPRANPPTIKLAKLSTSRPAAPSRPPLSKPLSTVSQHVAEHVSAGTRAIGQQASQLGQRIVNDDSQFDVQLKAKFDHNIGTLAASTPSSFSQPDAPPAKETPASQLAAMLANPDGVRQAVVLNEILKRPIDRW